MYNIDRIIVKYLFIILNYMIANCIMLELFPWEYFTYAYIVSWDQGSQFNDQKN